MNFGLQFIEGGLKLFVTPLAIGVYFIYRWQNWTAPSNLDLLMLCATIIYLIICFSPVEYTPDLVNGIDFSGIPDDVVEILTTTTTKGHFINVMLIQTFERSKAMSQTDLYEKVRERVNLTQPAVAPYIDKLESARLIESSTTQYKKKYVLTDRGKSCLKAIPQLFPKYTVLFWFRNEIGLRRIPAFSSKN